METALALPILLAAVLGIVEFGRAFMVGKMVTQAAREGARLASIGDSSNSDVRLHVKDSLKTALGIKRTDVTDGVIVHTITLGTGAD